MVCNPANFDIKTSVRKRPQKIQLLYFLPYREAELKTTRKFQTSEGGMIFHIPSIAGLERVKFRTSGLNRCSPDDATTTQGRVLTASTYSP